MLNRVALVNRVSGILWPFRQIQEAIFLCFVRAAVKVFARNYRTGNVVAQNVLGVFKAQNLSSVKRNYNVADFHTGAGHRASRLYVLDFQTVIDSAGLCGVAVSANPRKLSFAAAIQNRKVLL